MAAATPLPRNTPRRIARTTRGQVCLSHRPAALVHLPQKGLPPERAAHEGLSVGNGCGVSLASGIDSYNFVLVPYSHGARKPGVRVRRRDLARAHGQPAAEGGATIAVIANILHDAWQGTLAFDIHGL